MTHKIVLWTVSIFVLLFVFLYTISVIPAAATSYKSYLNIKDIGEIYEGGEYQNPHLIKYFDKENGTTCYTLGYISTYSISCVVTGSST